MTTQFIINHLWQSSCFALLAGLLALVLHKNSPKVRYWVWLSASLKFLVPFALLVSLGSVVRPPVRQGLSVPTVGFAETLVQMADPFSSTSYATVPARAPLDRVAIGMGILWALGFFAIIQVRYRSWVRIRSIVRRGKPVDLPIPVVTLIADGAEEPGVVGFLRPVLVLPIHLLERLNPRQLDAILMHELCHVRRRDNFFAAIHMGVEAIFWFHPLVWWIGLHMVEERELACDEEVLRAGCEPADYVEGILTVCRFYKEATSRCVSGVTGADITSRLRSVLAGSISRELSTVGKTALAALGLASMLLPIAVGALDVSAVNAQAPPSAQPNTFEVATVKPNKSGSGATLVPGLRNGTLSARNVTLKVLIRTAYGVSDRQIAGPSWLDADHFDLAGKAPKGVPDAQLMPLLQNLLKDRFQLTVHRETKVMPAFDMIVAKGGPKITPFDATHPVTPPKGYSGPMNFGVVTMPELAMRLTNDAGKVVLDKTGLNGRYSFMLLNYAPGPGSTQPNGAADSVAPDFVTAVEEQLGLKLVPKNEPVELIVVDKANRAPVEN
jgi:bla regulator protein blaR1